MADNAIDYNSEYNNRARVPECNEIMAGWARDAAAYRITHPPMTIPYGPGERERIDLFDAGQGAPLVMFIHGGYWQATDARTYSHLARGLNANGISVAVPSYDLCPNVSMAEIVEQMRAVAMKLHGIAGQKIVAVGHSAGGHLAACLLATDWKAIDPDLPDDLVPAAYSLSGLFDLPPLVRTYLNEALRLDDAEAKRLSPTFWTAPKGRTLHAIVGERESGEYHRQSREIVERWREGGAITTFEITPKANHFTIIAALADEHSHMVRDILRLARG